MTDSVFDQNTIETTTAAPSDQVEKQAEPQAQTQTPDYSDLLAGIKNEHGQQKYGSLEDAIKGLQHSQEFIETLKREKYEMEAKLKAKEELEELLTRPKNVSDPQPQVAAEPSLKPEDVEAILEQREVKLRHQANRNEFLSALKSQFGSEAQDKLVHLVESKGLTRELADQMAATSPKALCELLGVNPKPETQVPSNAVNTDAPKFTQEQERPYTPVMKAGTTTELVDGWRKSAEKALKKLEAN